MFNGIIYNIGEIRNIKRENDSILISIKNDLNLKKKDIGSSISCNGVCLTVINIKKGLVFFYLSKENLNRSNFRNIKIGEKINLEKSLTYGQKISGHFIQGHVDATAKIKRINFIDKTWEMKLEINNKQILKFLVEKASISINGVSLTISKIKKNYFYLNIIPHTLKLTNLKNLSKNDLVNVELDIFGKYMYKYSK